MKPGRLQQVVNQIALAQVKAPKSKWVQTAAAVKNLGLMIASTPLALVAGGQAVTGSQKGDRKVVYYTNIMFAGWANFRFALRPSTRPVNLFSQSGILEEAHPQWMHNKKFG